MPLPWPGSARLGTDRDSLPSGMRPLPQPMLLIPSGDGWAFELKYDGFRAIVSTERGLQVRSRRAWNMSDRVPELREHGLEGIVAKRCAGVYRPGQRAG
jgi:ATP-dependent DNA ligase